MWGSLPTGCPIRTSAGQCAFAARRSFSQLVTSFIASESPGIPHAPLVVPLFLHRTELSSIMLFAIDLLDCETSVVFLLLSLAIDSLELIHDCQSASSMSLSFFLSGEPRGGQAPWSCIFFHSDKPFCEASTSPERRCSSRTFRYGYLVTT